MILLSPYSSFNRFLSVVWIFDFESLLGRVSDVARLEQGCELDAAIGAGSGPFRSHVLVDQFVAEVLGVRPAVCAQYWDLPCATYLYRTHRHVDKCPTSFLLQRGKPVLGASTKAVLLAHSNRRNVRHGLLARLLGRVGGQAPTVAFVGQPASVGEEGVFGPVM